MIRSEPRRWLLLPVLATLSMASVCGGDDVEKQVSEIIRVLEIAPGVVVADVGAGDGEFALELARRVGPSGEIFATEVDSGKLEEIKVAASKAGLANLKPVLGNQDNTGLAAECCDAILVRHVYHHFEQPERMGLDLLAALRPGSLIAIIDFSSDNNFSRANVPAFRDGHGVAAERVIEEMTRLGFEFVLKKEGWDDDRDHYLLLFRDPAPPSDND